MIRLGKRGAAMALSLVVCLAIFTTGAVAQHASQRIGHNKISVSAHKVAVNSLTQEAARIMPGHAIQLPAGAAQGCSNNGWGNGCNGCGSRNNCVVPRSTFRCSSERICRTIEVCSRTRWGRVCQGKHVCRQRTICRRCNNSWGVTPWSARKR